MQTSECAQQAGDLTMLGRLMAIGEPGRRCRLARARCSLYNERGETTYAAYVRLHGSARSPRVLLACHSFRPSACCCTYYVQVNVVHLALAEGEVSGEGLYRDTGKLSSRNNLQRHSLIASLRLQRVHCKLVLCVSWWRRPTFVGQHYF